MNALVEFDPLGVFSEAIIGIIAAIAQQERVRQSDRVRAGLQRTKAQGVTLGRPRVADAVAGRTTVASLEGEVVSPIPAPR